MKPLFFFATLLLAAAAAAQEPGARMPARDSIAADGGTRTPAADFARDYPAGGEPTFDPARLPARAPEAPWSLWRFDPATLRMVRVEPAVTMSSVVVLRSEGLPPRVAVLDDNTLRLGRHVILSNGQAALWGPYPDALLDARTLSFPAR